jgi:hypothetical protein
MSESSNFLSRIINWLTSSDIQSENSSWDSKSQSAWAYGGGENLTVESNDDIQVCNEIAVEKKISNSDAIET